MLFSTRKKFLITFTLIVFFVLTFIFGCFGQVNVKAQGGSGGEGGSGLNAVINLVVTANGTDEGYPPDIIDSSGVGYGVTFYGSGQYLYNVNFGLYGFLPYIGVETVYCELTRTLYNSTVTLNGNTGGYYADLTNVIEVSSPLYIYNGYYADNFSFSGHSLLNNGVQYGLIIYVSPQSPTLSGTDWLELTVNNLSGFNYGNMFWSSDNGLSIGHIIPIGYPLIPVFSVYGSTTVADYYVTVGSSEETLSLTNDMSQTFSIGTWAFSYGTSLTMTANLESPAFTFFSIQVNNNGIVSLFNSGSNPYIFILSANVTIIANFGYPISTPSPTIIGGTIIPILTSIFGNATTDIIFVIFGVVCGLLTWKFALTGLIAGIGISTFLCALAGILPIWAVGLCIVLDITIIVLGSGLLNRNGNGKVD